MEDFKFILRNHNVRLRETVHALEIYRFVDNLSQIDLEQIKCEAMNHGNSIAIDKLIESICRKGTKSLISFVHGLQRCGNEDIANIIIKDIYKQCPNIYAALETLSKPVATVSPRTISPSPSTDTQQRNEDSTEDILDTVLNSLENEEFIYLAELLNIEKKWERLATKLKLKRKDIKELGCQENPAIKLLDDFSHLPVRQLLYYLDLANLGDVSENISIRLKIAIEPIVSVLCDQTCEVSDEVRTRTTNIRHQPGEFSGEVMTDNLRHQPGPQDDPNHDRDRLEEKKEYKAEKVETEINDMNISLEDSVKSSTDNEKVPTSDLPLGGAEGGTKNLINSLSSSTINIDKAATVIIHVGDQGENRNVVYPEDSMDSTDQNVSSEDNVTPSPVRNREDDALGNPSPEGSNPVINQTPTNRKDENSPFSHSSNQPRSALFQSPNGTQGLDTSSEDMGQPHCTRIEVTSTLVRNENSLVEDQGHGSTDGSNTSGQLLFHQPTDNQENSKNFVKNIEQEHLALNRDILNQPNMDSYRDIQNSIPGPRITDGPNEPNSIRQGEDRLHNRIGPIQNTSQNSIFTTNYQKNPEQERLALRRDVDMQNQILRTSNSCDEHQTSTKQLDGNTS